jgi:hypothetical protein
MLGMPRLWLIAAVLLAVSMPLSAQRGGGHASFGGRGGMSAHGGFAGHVGAGRASVGMRSRPGFAPRVYAHGSSFNRPFQNRGFNHFRNRDRDRRFRFGARWNHCYGYGCGWGYAYPYLWGGIDPYWWGDDSSYDQDQQDQIDMANRMNAQSLEEQQMRKQQDDPPGNQDAFARSMPPAAPQANVQPAPATVLVFRDQHKMEVQNYAIVGQTLWNFTPQRTQKIPLSDLDLQATVKVNDERGIEFRLPNPHEAE